MDKNKKTVNIKQIIIWRWNLQVHYWHEKAV